MTAASVCIWLTLSAALFAVQCTSGKTAAPRQWSLAELSVTSSELPKQIPAPPYPQLQQRVQSTPHYDQQLKLPSGNGRADSRRSHHRRHHQAWTEPTVSVN